MANGITLSEAPATGLGKLLIESRFQVPNHQRNYSWTEDEVKQLLDDLEGAIDRKDPFYFVGLMVFMVSVDGNLIVLDGQQRLATAVIMMSAIRSWLRPIEKYSEAARSIQDDFIGRPELGETEIRPKLSLNFYNNQTFQDYAVKGRPLSDAKKALADSKRFDPNYNLLKALVQCHGRVVEIVGKSANADAAANYLINLVKYIRDSTAVVRLTVPNEASAYRVFETLNDRGLDLSAMDLVKNLLFSLAVSHSKSWLSDMEQRWAQMTVTLAGAKADEFLKVYWTSRKGRVQAADLYSDIKKSCATAVGAVDLSVDMLLASEQYAALDNADDTVWAPLPPEVRHSIRALKILGSKQVRPVILAAVVKFEAYEFVRLLRLLEVVIVRYQLVGGERTGTIEIACARLSQLIFSEKTRTATQALADLHDIYLSDDDFKQAFLLKQESSNQKAQYLLRRLEQETRRQDDGKMHGEETLGEALTVEHVLPKNAGEDWKRIVEADPSIIEECAERLGNLCLLTKVNRDLGRAAFDKKRQIFAESKIRTTAELTSWDTWDRKSIEARQANMAKLAVGIWRFQ
jgi:hypothetical protein